MIPTGTPIQRLSRSSRSLAMNSAFCSKVVSYLEAFMAAKITFPRNGMYFNHESIHIGGVVAQAVNLPDVFVGTLISRFSGVIVLGHSRDQSTE